LKKKILQMENLIQGYILACRAENKSPGTVQWYGDSSIYSCTFCRSSTARSLWNTSTKSLSAS
jgi:hypothetical protein